MCLGSCLLPLLIQPKVNLIPTQHTSPDFQDSEDHLSESSLKVAFNINIFFSKKDDEKLGNLFVYNHLYEF
jgi:hypothetical protein